MMINTCHLILPSRKVSNKVIIGNTDCISTLSPVLDESKDMLKRNQFLTIGIFKLLCTNNCKYSFTKNWIVYTFS
jgi:hypothetical protein